jgi:hypothetical protein
MALTKVQAGLLEATGTADSTTFLRGDGAWSTPVASALSTASGSAPSYSARAWVNFNGTGTVAIRGSGNVTSITDNAVGDYTLNFTTAMPNTNYAVITNAIGVTNTNPVIAGPQLTTIAVGSVRIYLQAVTNGSASYGAQDIVYFNNTIFC